MTMPRPSVTVRQLTDAVRAELARRRAEHEPEFYVQISESEGKDLAAGFVPLAVQARVRTMLEWEDQDRRRAARPVKRRR